MSMRESAALVAARKAIAGNAEEAAGAAPADGLLGARESLVGEEEPRRRSLKQGGQYTGRSWLGWKGTVVEAPHSVQTAWCRRLRPDKRGRVDTDARGMWKQNS